MSDGTQFLNVDLDIYSADDLAPLARALAAATDMLRCDQLESGDWLLVLELSGSPASAEAAIAGLLDAIDALPDDAHRLWRGARKRCFDIGVEAADGPTWKSELTPGTLRRLGEQLAAVEITIYGPRAGGTA